MKILRASLFLFLGIATHVHLNAVMTQADLGNGLTTMHVFAKSTNMNRYFWLDTLNKLLSPTYSINSDAIINDTDNAKQTPLHYAASLSQDCYAYRVPALIAKGAYPELQDDNGNLALHIAARSGAPLSVVQALLETYPEGLNQQNQHGLTPLNMACANGCTEIGIYFIQQAGTNVMLQDNWGYSPLHFAVMAKNIPLVNQLLAHGAQANTANKWGYTPLHLAVDLGLTTITAALLQAHATPNTTDQYEHTPLHAAVTGDDATTTIMLLGAGADFNKRDAFHLTPLDHARNMHRKYLVSLFPESQLKAATMNEKDEELETY